MLFNSYQFIFAFVPLTFFIYGLLSGQDVRWRMSFLLIASLFFYGYWNPVYVPLLVASIAINYQTASFMLISARFRRAILIGGIAFNLGLIGFFKYAGFAVVNLNILPGVEFEVPHFVLPLAISFFTFQQIAFLVDTYRGLVGRVSMLNYAVFVSFFPQLIAGPIVHHQEMMPQFAKRQTLLDYPRLAIAFSFFTIGLFKKVVIADGVAPVANRVFTKADAGALLSTPEALIGPIAYTFQLYFDFSGYSDMAIGLALLFGIRLPINFNSPYKAASITEFWRRWHMTLSRFLRDYLYIPLGGNRKGTVRRCLNLMLTMLLGGLWHGAGWTFVIWGGLHGLLLLGHQLWRSAIRQLGWRSIPNPIGVATTFVVVSICWIFFRAETVGGALNITSTLLDPGTLYMTSNEVKNLFGAGGQKAAYTVVLLCLAFLVTFFVPNTAEYHFEPERKWSFKADLPHLAFLIGLWVAIILTSGQNSEFLYFQF